MFVRRIWLISSIFVLDSFSFLALHFHRNDSLLVLSVCLGKNHKSDAIYTVESHYSEAQRDQNKFLISNIYYIE